MNNNQLKLCNILIKSMQSQNLTIVKVRNQAIRILKQKKQWTDQVTKVQITYFHIKNYSVFLIEVNIVSSTMLLSENWSRDFFSLDTKPLIFAFRADYQSIGRGQNENSWESPLGNLYLTLLLKLQFQISYLNYLPLISISNVFRIIKNYLNQSKSDSQAKIKWINDIIIDYEKVSGLLIKNQIIGKNLYTQIGIGVNIKKNPQNLLQIKQSCSYLQKHTGKQIQIKQFTQKIINQFVQTLFVLNFQGVKINGKKQYEQNLAYLNRLVDIYDYKYEKILASGVFKGINEYGQAIIEGHQRPLVLCRMKPQQKIL